MSIIALFDEIIGGGEWRKRDEDRFCKVGFCVGRSGAPYADAELISTQMTPNDRRNDRRGDPSVEEDFLKG